MKNIIIREIRSEEISILNDFLYEAIYQPNDAEPLPRDIIKRPEISLYTDNFGQKKDDYCLVAEEQGKIVGAVWIRILADEIKGYGNIDDETPEFSISLLKEYRGKGVGTDMMTKMIGYMINKGYKQTSLSVNKDNYAIRLYKNTGFEIVKENAEDYIMLLKL